ncbi:ABC transporter permease [Clostridium botulinum]|nr:ABC transporter permease [Clostridium botulinum]
MGENKQKNKVSNNLINILKSLAFPLLAIVVSIFVSVFFVMWAKGYSITQYFSAFGDLFSTIWNGSFGDKRKTLETMIYVTPLIFTGVANAIAFRCGLFNIGVEGQFIVGMISAAIIGLIPGLNPIVHGILIVLGGIVAGSIWAGIPGYLKAKIGTNEVINTIMMNYLGLYFANYIILRSRFAVKGSASTPLIKKSAELLRFSNLSRANISLIIGILCAIFVFWLLWKTTVGYEIRAVGFNPSGAEYGGINIAKNTILAMVLSGAVAGIGGATHVAGVMHQAQDMMALPGFGFDGIAVALLAKNNPIGCIPSAILFGALNSSSKMLQLNGIPKEIVYLVQSIIIIFVATDYIVKYFSEKKSRKVLMNE